MRRAPAMLAAPAVVALLFLVVPLVAVLAKAPWHRLPHLITSPAARTALRLSLECSFGALALSLIVGVPLAWVLARVEFPGKSVLRALVMVPLVLPPVVGGVALLLAFGRTGLVGAPLHEVFGLQIPFTTAAAIMAETFVAMPFLVIAVEGGVRSLDPRYEEAARALGAKSWMVFARVTLPLVRPAIFSGAVLCWARALGEFGATITFAGNLPGRTQTMPLAVYVALETTRPEGAIVLSLILLAVSIAILVGMRDRWLGAL